MTGKITGALREQSDWEQQDENRLGFIKNKPFYDARKTEEIRIPMMVGETLEGVVSGYSYKLSDITPSLEELNSAVIETEEGTLPISAIGEFSEKIFIENKAYILENDDFGFTMAVFVELNNTASLSKGIYVKTLTDYEAYFVITRTTGELKTIDPKFLPVVDLYFALGMIDDDSSNPYLYTSPNVNDESKRVTLAQMNEYLAEKKLLRFWCSEDGLVLGCTMEYSFSATPEGSAVFIRMLGEDAMFEIS